ncbi:MAG: NUDIX hydrolase [Nitriliruptoraceae bacterium]
MSDERTVTPDWSGSAAVEAAGGVVLRDGSDGHEVLVVHRVRHDDWSLPKGKLDPDEPHVVAAVREVEEETGVRAQVLEELSQVVYAVPEGAKRVRWYAMAHLGGDPADRPADREVDVARWVAVEEAAGLLTYAADVDLLDEALAHRAAGGAS